jgi:hypothetical protein
VRGGVGIVGVLNVGGNIVVSSGTASNDTTTGALVVGGGAGLAGNLTVGGVTVMGPSAETYAPLTGATGVVAHSFASGTTFYHTTPAASFTANFTNMPLTGSRVIVMTLVIVQGATAYIPSAIQINGASATVKWLSGSALVAGNTNKVDVISYSCFYSGSAWTVLGQYANYS